MDEPKSQPTKTVSERLAALLKPAVVAAAKRTDHVAAKVLASINERLRRLQKK